MKKKKLLLTPILLSLTFLQGCNFNKTKEYTVSFNSQSGSEVKSQTVSEGNTVIEPKAPKKDKYNFLRWTTDQEGQSPYNFKTAVKSNLELFAQWEETKFTVTFDPDNGGEFSFVNVKEGESLGSKPINDPIKKGYVFLEWQFDGKTYDFTSPVNSNITLKAKYTIESYDVLAVSESESKGTVSGGKKYIFNEMATLTAVANPGYEFNGWYIEGKQEPISTHQTYSFLVEGNVSLTAKFKAIEYKIKYNNVNELEIKSSGNPTIYHIDDPEITLNSVKSSRPGLKFSGWYIDSELKTSINKIPTGSSEDKNIYAKWEETDKKAVIFDTLCLNDETIDPVYVSQGSTIDTKPEYNPIWATRDDDAKWFYLDSNNQEQEFIFGASGTIVNDNMALYPKYTSVKDQNQEDVTKGLTYGSTSSAGYYVSGNYKLSNLKEINIPYVYKLEDTGYYCYINEIHPFTDCTKLEKINIPSTVGMIKENAFSGLKGLNNVVFDTNNSELTLINIGAFQGTSIKELNNLPDSLLMIKENAFSNCNKLTDIKIPKNTTLLSSPFIGCTSLNNIQIDPDNAWYSTKGTTNSIYEIETDGTYNLFFSSADTLTLDNDVKKICKMACQSSNLTNVKFNSNLEEIGEYAFADNSKLTSITIPSDTKLKRIGSYAFASTSLTGFTFPSSIEYIGESVFHSCKSIGEVKFDSNVTISTIPDLAFNGSFVTKIKLPDTVTSIGKDAFYNTDLSEGVEISPNSKLTSIGSSAFMCSRIVSFKIPSTVTTLGLSVFMYCSKLKSIYIDSATVANYTNNESSVFIKGQAEGVDRVVYVKKEIVLSSSSYLLTGGFTRTGEVEGYAIYKKV